MFFGRGKESPKFRINEATGVVNALAQEYLNEAKFSLGSDGAIGFPGEAGVQHYQMTISLPDEFSPYEQYFWGKDTYPGISVTKRLKNPYLPSGGWTVELSRVVLENGHTVEECGLYEKILVDMETGEMACFQSGRVLDDPQAIKAAYRLMVQQLKDNRGKLVSAAFKDRNSRMWHMLDREYTPVES